MVELYYLDHGIFCYNFHFYPNKEVFFIPIEFPDDKLYRISYNVCGTNSYTVGPQYKGNTHINYFSYFFILKDEANFHNLVKNLFFY